MKEIGGYIEFEYNYGKEYYSNLIKLNCGRNALAYLIESYEIKKICLPYFLCSSVQNTCKKYKINITFYHIDKNFKPLIFDELDEDTWLYVVNYYGQLQNDYIKELKIIHEKLIIDNAQAFFQSPLDSIPTIYTCRKYFGVADGAYLSSEKKISRELLQDYSYDRMNFLLGRFEKTAFEFYSEYSANNKLFANEEVKVMSRLTENILKGIDYGLVKKRRRENFEYLSESLSKINILNLSVSDGAFAYPLLVKDGANVKKKLQAEKIYIPTLWPDVFDVCNENDLEYRYARDILPIPVDQRYGKEEMAYMVERIKLCID